MIILAMNILPAPIPISNEIEVFGTYENQNDQRNYTFHLWMGKYECETLYGKIDLPFTCTTANKMFCIYKDESSFEEGGKII